MEIRLLKLGSELKGKLKTHPVFQCHMKKDMLSITYTRKAEIYIEVKLLIVSI